MDPRLYLRLAHDLAARGGTEHLRSAISRAYYAVYNVAVDLLREVGVRVESGHGAHEFVRAQLHASNVGRLVRAGSQLRRLHLLRVKADY